MSSDKERIERMQARLDSAHEAIGAERGRSSHFAACTLNEIARHCESDPAFMACLSTEIERLLAVWKARPKTLPARAMTPRDTPEWRERNLDPEFEESSCDECSIFPCKQLECPHIPGNEKEDLRG